MRLTLGTLLLYLDLRTRAKQGSPSSWTCCLDPGTKETQPHRSVVRAQRPCGCGEKEGGMVRPRDAQASGPLRRQRQSECTVAHGTPAGEGRDAHLLPVSAPRLPAGWSELERIPAFRVYPRRGSESHPSTPLPARQVTWPTAPPKGQPRDGGAPLPWQRLRWPAGAGQPAGAGPRGGTRRDARKEGGGCAQRPCRATGPQGNTATLHATSLSGSGAGRQAGQLGECSPWGSWRSGGGYPALPGDRNCNGRLDAGEGTGFLLGCLGWGGCGLGGWPGDPNPKGSSGRVRR